VIKKKKNNKRIEINEEVAGARVRASRTGGINVSASPVKGVTLNSKHGMRVSKTFKGLTLGAQNFSSVVRGRWSAGGMNVNLSKSGLSASNKNVFGTFNFRRPKSSSTTIMGIQVRGTVGAVISFLGMFISLISFLFKAFFFLVPRIFLLTVWLLQLVWNSLIFLSSLIIYLVIDLPKQIFRKTNEQ